MAKDTFIKMDGASVNVAYVLSFSTEKDFIEDADSKLYLHRDSKTRRSLLRSLFKHAHKQANEPSKSGGRTAH